MPLHVQRQVVAAGKRSLADGAEKRSVARVLAVVARQLVGPGELPPAADPVAAIRLFAGVRPHVRLEVRAFRVRLAAAGARADV